MLQIILAAISISFALMLNEERRVSLYEDWTNWSARESRSTKSQCFYWLF